MAAAGVTLTVLLGGDPGELLLCRRKEGAARAAAWPFRFPRAAVAAGLRSLASAAGGLRNAGSVQNAAAAERRLAEQCFRILAAVLILKSCVYSTSGVAGQLLWGWWLKQLLVSGDGAALPAAEGEFFLPGVGGGHHSKRLNCFQNWPFFKWSLSSYVSTVGCTEPLNKNRRQNACEKG